MWPQDTFYEKIKSFLERVYDDLSDISIPAKFVALIIPIVIIMLLYQNNRIAIFKGDLDLIEDSLNETQREYIVLYNRFVNLTSYYKRVISNNLVLSSDIVDLEEEIENLNMETTKLRDEKFGTITELNAAQQLYLDLVHNYTSLITENEFLQNELNELRASSLHRTFPLESGRIIELQPVDSLTLVYNFSYAGFLEINFSSSNDVYFWIGSSVDNEYYARWPLWPDIASSGSVRLPVCKDVIFYVNNPNNEVITIDLSLRIIY